jgi:type VI secretion system protein VasD
LILLLFVFGQLTGCASVPKPTLVKANITANSSLNPDAKGRSSPVVVRYFELKSLAAFNDADFFSLAERDRETLGADLVASEEFLLKPGETLVLDRTLDPAVNHIGVVAAFRDLEHAQWRVSFPVPSQRTSKLTIRLDDRRISINSN